MTYILLISSVLLGSIISAYLKSKRDISIKFLLVFSGAFLLSLGVFHLLPEVYEVHDHSIGLWVMGGFFIQLVLEVFSKGVEHGHGHPEHFKHKGIPLAVMISLFVHALLESLPIGAHADHISSNTLLWGIVIHKLPVSIILYAMLTELTKSKWKIFAWMLVFALIAPIGVWLGEALPVLEAYYRQLTALTLGVFIHISTTILFESSKSHKFNFIKFFVTLLGVVIAWISVSHH